MPQRWDAQGNPIAETAAAQPTQRWDATGKPITGAAPAPSTTVSTTQPSPVSRALSSGIGEFAKGWGVDPEKVSAQPTLLGKVGEAGKEAISSIGSSIAGEWKQPTVGGFGGKSTPLPPDQATAARFLFPAHLIARGVEGIAGGLESATSDIASGTPEGIGGGVGKALSLKSQVAVPEKVFDLRPHLDAVNKLLDRQIALNKGRVGLVNNLKRAGTMLENAVTGEQGEVGRHAQAVIAADKMDLARSQSEGKVPTAGATLAAQAVMDKTKMGGVAGGYPASMPLDSAKALITQLGREGSRLVRGGKAPEAAAVWAEYDALRKATQERANALGPDMGKSWAHYINEFHNYIQLKKGLFGHIMEDSDHAGILNKVLKGDYAAQIPEIKEWMRKYRVDPEPLDYALKQGAKLEELTQQSKNMFMGKLRAIARHPLAAGSVAATAAVAGHATGVPGMGFVLPLLLAGKVAGIIDTAEATKLLKGITRTVGLEMERVTPSPEGPQPLPQPAGGAPAPAGYSGPERRVATEEDWMEQERRRPTGKVFEKTPEEIKGEQERKATAEAEEALSKSAMAGKLKGARSVYKGRRGGSKPSYGKGHPGMDE